MVGDRRFVREIDVLQYEELTTGAAYGLPYTTGAAGVSSH